MRLDHVTIRTAHPAETRDFFLAVFDRLVERPRPRAIQRIPGHWLFSEGDPILHIIGVPGTDVDTASEAWDHVGFRLTDHDAFCARLNQLGIAYSRMALPELEERRIFLRTPFGPVIEVVFRDV